MDETVTRADESSSQRLTDWQKEPTVQQLKRDLEAAWSSHSAQLAKIDEWNDILHVRGDAKPKTVKGRSKVQPKLVRRQAEWRYSALTEPFLGSDKIFSVKPATWADMKAAKQNELVLNWQFRTKLNRVNFIDNYVRATVDDGTCVVKTGWRRVTVKVTKPAPVWAHYPIQSQEQAQQLQQAIALKQDDPRGFANKVSPEIQQAVEFYEESQQPTVALQQGTQDVETEEVIENFPTLEVIHPKNVIIDPSCNGDFSKAMFAIHSFETCKADLMKEADSKGYKNLDQVQWESNSPGTEANHATTTPPDFAVEDKSRRKVVAYEYWGLWDIQGDGKLVPMVATWIGPVMIRLSVNPYPDQKIPFVLVPYLPKKRELYGETDAELLEDNQKILGAVTRGMVDLLGRSANGQQGIAKGMLDPLNRKRYDNGEDYEFNPGSTIPIIEHKFPELPQSALVMTQMVNQDAEALTGVKSFSGGLSGQAYGDVAAGIKGMLDAAAKREMAILRRLALGMVQIGQKIIAMNSEFLSEEETINVTQEEFVKVTRDELKGNFELVTDISTAEVDNAKSQDLAFMVQTCGPNVGPDILLMLLSEIADLKRMPELAHKLKNYKPPPPPPEQQQMMQLQLQEQQLKISLLQSQIQLNQSKAEFEGARKDKTNLDYVEQETGTSHLRDMQKLESQGRANQNLEVTKALLHPKKPEEREPDVKAAVGFNQLSGHLMNQ